MHTGNLPTRTLNTAKVLPSEKARLSMVSTQHSLSPAAGTINPVQLVCTKH